MKILRRIHGVRLIDRVKNKEILEALKCGDLPDMVDHRRRRYLGHIYRYPKERIVRQSLEVTWNASANRKRRGKKRQTWLSMVKKDLKDHDLDLTVDKKVWRTKIAELYWGEENSGGEKKEDKQTIVQNTSAVA